MNSSLSQGYRVGAQAILGGWSQKTDADAEAGVWAWNLSSASTALVGRGKRVAQTIQCFSVFNRRHHSGAEAWAGAGDKNVSAGAWNLGSGSTALV